MRIDARVPDPKGLQPFELCTAKRRIIGTAWAPSITTAPRSLPRARPGRTMISAHAAPGVRSFTLRTTTRRRDAAPDRAQPLELLVFDGEFVSDQGITVPATLQDGRRVTQTLPLGP